MVGESAFNCPRAQKKYAEGGTRTPTGMRPLRPERSASTNSTTSAFERGRLASAGCPVKVEIDKKKGFP